MARRNQVAILGGGVAGLTCAHELIERGFQVTVYEKNSALGGKARSYGVRDSAHDGRLPLPAEHGFRFFAGFYKHLPDTMKRIPIPDGEKRRWLKADNRQSQHTVFDNLVEAPRVQVARQGEPPLDFPIRFPRTRGDVEVGFTGLLQAAKLGIPADEVAYFANRLLLIASSCEERRVTDYENVGWWEFIGAPDRSSAYQHFLASGPCRTLVACRPEEISARTGGQIISQLLFELLTPGLQVDRLLNGPTSEVWIDPWVRYLREHGVRFECNTKIDRIECTDGRITGVFVNHGKIDAADYYIAALPVNVIRDLVTKQMGDRDPGLWRLHELYTSWMNGIQFYLKEDVPIIAGHVIYTDSPWALTSISQQQFWSKSISQTYGDGQVGGILSVDVSNWDVPGTLYKKPASECSREEIEHEVWLQLKDHLNRSGVNLLKDSNLALTGMDRDICCDKARHSFDCINREPMMINTVGSLNSRPDATTKIENLFLASDYVRTFTDLATMEAANEAARRAVNGILKASGSAQAPCQLWPMKEPLILSALREIDGLCYAAGKPHPLAVRLESSLSDFVISAILRPQDELSRLEVFTEPLKSTLARVKSVSFSDVEAWLGFAAQGLHGLSLDRVRSGAVGGASNLARYSLRKVTHQPKYVPDPEANIDERRSKVASGADGVSVQDTAKTKVAILGGGISSITAAFKLTSTPELRERFEVTVYQRGWRIGGKGASGRNRLINDRIEEHGLHVWFGFYHNAFKLMRDCYAELERAEGAPLRTLEDAFKPCDNLVLFESEYGWKGWQFSLPRNNFRPGHDVNLPAFWDVTHVALGWLWSFWEMLIGRGSDLPGAPAPSPEDARSKAKRLLLFAEETGLFKKVMSLAWSHKRRPAADREGEEPFKTLAQLLAELRNSIANKYSPADFQNDALRRFFECLDFATTVVCGIVSDELLIKGFDSVNYSNLKNWLIKHGIDQEITLNGPLGRLSYDATFAFIRGNPKLENYAAGTALMGLLRGLFCYAGAVSFKMQAGMGDAVFAPLYQVLKDRKVRFKFFHSIQRLRLSSDKQSIESIDFVRQVDLESSSDSAADYAPLFDVKGIPCWPSEPLWEKIKPDDVAGLRKKPLSNHPNFPEIRDSCWNLEHESNPLGKPTETLHRGRNGDFDIVILGIPVDELSEICIELVKNQDKPEFKRMCDNSATTMTQAFQLWTSRTLDGLGWPFLQNSVACGYSDPYDTYCNMSQLLCRESWDASNGPIGLDYFCSALDDTRPEGGNIKSQEEADGQARRNAVAYLRERVNLLWPDSRVPGNNKEFNWDLLYSSNGGYQGEERFDSQYWIANFQPSERYTLCPAREIAYRLKTDESGYENLYLTGDWIKNGMNAGCIESAVIAGLEAARAITHSTEKIIGEDDHPFLIPSSKREGSTSLDEAKGSNGEERKQMNPPLHEKA
jgi:15-cis-phytoene desaturase